MARLPSDCVTGCHDETPTRIAHPATLTVFKPSNDAASRARISHQDHRSRRRVRRAHLTEASTKLNILGAHGAPYGLRHSEASLNRDRHILKTH